ncbi:MAG TPA: thioredoxin fold domain-containing protein [Burkholderiales bacterium]|nr:thioredoxin fold domain-containing protein [Burkholderiales bacterium]
MAGTLAMLAAVLLAPARAAAQARNPYQHFFDLNSGDLREEAADAARAGKKALFVMYEQEGCPGCIYMKQHVLNRPEVQAFYRARFVNLAIDIRGAVPLRDFSGREHTEKSLAQSLGVRATPTLAFYDFTGAEIVRHTGAVRDAAEFLLLGEFVASEAYRTGTFAQFRQSRASGKGG